MARGDEQLAMSTDENTITQADGGTTEPQAPAAAPEAPAAQGSSEAPPSREAQDEARSTGEPQAPAAASAADDDWEEQPGDDIGNRLPGPSGRLDANRRAPERQSAKPADRPPVRHDARAPRPQPLPANEASPPTANESAPADASATETPAEGAPAKKRRRRRRRKPGSGAAAGAAPAGAEGAASAEDGEADDGEAEGEKPAATGEEGESGEGGEEEATAEGGGPSEKGSKRKRRGPSGPGGPARERPAFSAGEEVFGKISRITELAIWVDIAGKATGLFDRRELGEGDLPSEGDQFLATVASNGVRGGMLMLSQAPVNLDQSRERIEAASKSGEVVEGFVTGAVKGGLEVDLGGLRAFAPASHVDLRHGADLSYLVGQRLDFHVTQYAKKGRDIVVSRKKALEEDARRARTEALSNIEAGSVHKGVVRTVVQWGAFIALPDAGGVEGLVHMTEASHDRGAKLNDLFRPGAEIEVKVLRVDEKGKLWLSRKAVTADPWDAVKQKYAVGSRHKGKIARLQPFGAFIELEPGVDGLCHTADLSLKAIEHPSEVVNVGDEIDVVVSSCDAASHKIALHPAPSSGEDEEPRQRVQQYKPVKVAVVEATEAGLLVRILGVTGRAARGFIPAGHTGTPRGTDLRKEFPAGARFDAKVLEIDPRRGEAKLSIRALKDDVEKAAYQQYRAGVAREAKFGTFADLMKKS
jgi:small subunit ribosomal protein S1